MPRGKVKSFNGFRGYGFIIVDGSQDIYFHVTDLRGGIKTLKKGDKVSFDLVEIQQAKNVVKVLEPILSNSK